MSVQKENLLDNGPKIRRSNWRPLAISLLLLLTATGWAYGGFVYYKKHDFPSWLGQPAELWIVDNDGPAYENSGDGPGGDL